MSQDLSTYHVTSSHRSQEGGQKDEKESLNSYLNIAFQVIRNLTFLCSLYRDENIQVCTLSKCTLLRSQQVKSLSLRHSTSVGRVPTCCAESSQIIIQLSQLILDNHLRCKLQKRSPSEFVMPGLYLLTVVGLVVVAATDPHDFSRLCSSPAPGGEFVREY